MRMSEWEAFSRCLKQNAWVAAYFAGLDIGADDAGWTFTFKNLKRTEHCAMWRVACMRLHCRGTIFTLMDTNGSICLSSKRPGCRLRELGIPGSGIK